MIHCVYVSKFACFLMCVLTSACIKLTSWQAVQQPSTDRSVIKKVSKIEREIEQRKENKQWSVRAEKAIQSSDEIILFMWLWKCKCIFLLWFPSLFHSLIQCIFFSVVHPSFTFSKHCRYHLDRIVWGFHSIFFFFLLIGLCVLISKREHNAWCDGKVLANPW